MNPHEAVDMGARELPARSFRVLVVDDTQANRALLRAYLTRLGFEVLMAEDGEQALDVYFCEKPDLVLMDLMMPRMDGFEAIAKMREFAEERWVPIVIVSAMDAEYDVVRGLEAGADDYLTKPLSFQLFAAKMRNLRRALELQQSREEARQREAAVSDAVVDGILTFDESFRVLGANRAAEFIFVTPGMQLLGHDVRKLLAESPGARPWEQRLAAYLAGDDPGFIGSLRELNGWRLDGRSFPAEMCITELPVVGRRLFIAVVRDISERRRVGRQLAENAARLQQYHDEAEAEAELAKEIMERHVRRDALEQSGVLHCVMPTQRFSGDIVLAARSSSGLLYAMLADATGHGLAAAMSGLTIVTDFYHAVENEMPLPRMVQNLNNALAGLLPVGRFVSAALAVLDQRGGCGQMWLGGVPDVLQIDPAGGVCARYASNHLPLGIEELADDALTIIELRWTQPAQLLLCSDGLIEAISPRGESFDYAGVSKALAGLRPNDRLAALQLALRRHLDAQAGHDDISMMLLDLPACA